MDFDTLSSMDVFSLVCIVVTVLNFLMGIPILLQIHKRGNTDEISSFPFLITLISNNFWIRYGVLRNEVAIWGPNCIGLYLYIVYTCVYIYYTRKKLWILVKLLVIYTIILSVLCLVHFQCKKSYESTTTGMGMLAACVQVVTFGAPIANMVTVVKNHHCNTMPLPLILFSTVVSSLWLAFGILTSDLWVIIPNSLGLFLLLAQLSLFLVFPMAKGKRALLGYFFQSIRDLEPASDQSKDDEEDKKQLQEDVCVSI